MSLTTHALLDDGLFATDAAPVYVLVGVVLIVGIWAALSGNFDMGSAASSLLIGP
jgi:hypothetical protein